MARISAAAVFSSVPKAMTGLLFSRTLMLLKATVVVRLGPLLLGSVRPYHLASSSQASLGDLHRCRSAASASFCNGLTRKLHAINDVCRRTWSSGYPRYRPESRFVQVEVPNRTILSQSRHKKVLETKVLCVLVVWSIPAPRGVSPTTLPM